MSFIAPRERRQWLLSLGFGLLLILATALLLFDTYWGDPVIYLPYARSAASGDFFAYNPGQFSSGSTSPLWGLILSIAFIAGGGPFAAKAVALVATVASFLLVASAAARVNGRTLATGLPVLYAVEMMTIFGLMMYESPLVVAAVALSITVGLGTMQRWWAEGRLHGSSLLKLALVWAMLPLSRPDATVLVPLQIAAMWLLGPERRFSSLLRFLAAAVAAAVPAALYFGYSLATLGLVSVSSEGRAFALRESADRLGPLSLSRAAIGYLGGILYALGLAALGHDLLRRSREEHWLAVYGVSALIVYPVLLVFVSPVTNDLARYFLPMAPFVVIGAGRALRNLPPAAARAWPLTAALVVLLFVAKPAVVLLGEAWSQSKRGYTFEAIVEKDAMDLVNRLAAPGDTLLAYEVQDRYALRPDVTMLSLDGITDGLVTPWLESADMAGFIRHYRPDFWLANDAVNYRPYLRRSILREVLLAFQRDTSLSTLERSAVRFTLVTRRQRPMPRGFAGWRMLFRLEYSDAPR